MIRRLRTYISGDGLGPILIKAVTGSAGLRIVGMGFGFLVGIQLARGLGVEGYGVYGIAMATVSLLGVPSEFGLPQLLTREVAAAHHLGDFKRLISTRRWALRISIFSSGCIFFGLFAWAAITRGALVNGLAAALLVGALMIPLVAIAKINGATLRGMQRLVSGQLPDTLIRPATYSALLAGWYLIFGKFIPMTAMALGVGSVAIAVVVSSAMLVGSMPALKSRVEVGVNQRKLLASAMPMALTEGLRIVQSQIVIVLLGFLASVAVVGLYRVSASVVNFIAMPIALFNVVAAPVIARLHAAGDTRRLQRLLGWLSAGMFGGTLLLASPFFICGEWIMQRVFGAQYAEAAPILRILCIGVLANGFFGSNAGLLNMTGFEKFVTRASIVSVTFLLLLLPFGVMLFGGVGAAWVTTCSLVLWNIIMWRDAKKRLSLGTTLFTIISRKI